MKNIELKQSYVEEETTLTSPQVKIEVCSQCYSRPICADLYNENELLTICLEQWINENA